jgi:ribosomal protein S27AE/nucleoid DNA-binding protein
LKHRAELARRTARALGYNPRYAGAVIREFVVQANDFLRENGVLVLDEFGRFTVEVVQTNQAVPMQLRDGAENVTREVEVDRYVRVHFSKSRTLKKLLDEHHLEEPMDKYGVDTSTGKDDEQLEKQAGDGCPDCGSSLTKHGSVVACPKCGTAPFEAKPDGG